MIRFAYYLMSAVLLTTLATGGRAGEWMPESTWGSKKGEALPQLIEAAQSAELRGDYKRAMGMYKQIEDRSVNLRNKGRAAMKQGYCLEKLGKSWQAYNRYRRAADSYTSYVPFNEILDAEFRIAGSYLAGEKRDHFLFFSFATYDKAIEIYEHIIKLGPFSDLAPEAVYNIGRAQILSEEYPLAIQRLNQVLTKYPRSAIVPDARIELARALLKAAEAGDGDGEQVQQARRVLDQFDERYPGHPRAKEAAALLHEAREVAAKRLLYLSEFYQRSAHRRSEASEQYLRDILQDYPDTTSAALAEKYLSDLEE